MITTRRSEFLFGLLVFCLMFTGVSFNAPAYAQNVSEAFSGLSASSRDPIEIEADELVVQDRNKTAVFRGNVRLVQGPTTLRASSITVYYSGKASGATQKISKVEARGPIKVTSRDQTARGDKATFMMDSQVLTLVGHVILTKGGNELRGERLTVNLKTGESKIESPNSSSGGRVRGVFLPGKQ
ncbi:MAG: lipopolysaccharide transport periplasmic protein LptA [Rhizobiales bacterium]|nr:lipopolysaccharide transport periplasmic protein LptA [Hyphomicrobiales bacterium]